VVNELRYPHFDGGHEQAKEPLPLQP
jgi:hypothetical protein